MVKPLARAIEIFEKTDQTITITVKDKDGTVKDVTGYAFRFSISLTRTAAPTITKDTASGITLTTPTSGIITVTLDTTEISLAATAEDAKGTYELIEYSGGSLSGDPTGRIQGNILIRDAIYEP